MRYSRKIGYFWIAILVALLDFVSKAIVKKYFAELVVSNDNVALNVSLGGLELAVTVFITATLIYFLAADKIPASYRISTALIIGGGAGNVIDRLADGSICDFIRLGRFPTFNISDMFITAGIAIIIYRAFTDNKTSL